MQCRVSTVVSQFLMLYHHSVILIVSQCLSTILHCTDTAEFQPDNNPHCHSRSNTNLTGIYFTSIPLCNPFAIGPCQCNCLHRVHWRRQRLGGGNSGLHPNSTGPSTISCYGNTVHCRTVQLQPANSKLVRIANRGPDYN